MRLCVTGRHPSAQSIREMFSHERVNWDISNVDPVATLYVEIHDAPYVAISCKNKVLETRLLSQMEEVDVEQVMVLRHKLSREESFAEFSAIIFLPRSAPDETLFRKVEIAAFRAYLLLASPTPKTKVGAVELMENSESRKPAKRSAAPMVISQPRAERRPWWRLRWLLLIIATVLQVRTVYAQAKSSPTPTFWSIFGVQPILLQTAPGGIIPFKVDMARMGGTDISGNVYDTVNDSIRVTPVGGGGGGGGGGPATANNTGACLSVSTATTSLLAAFATASCRMLYAPATNTATVYLKLGATATASNFPVPAGSALNLCGGSVYTGAIDGIAASGSQSICVMEY